MIWGLDKFHFRCIIVRMSNGSTNDRGKKLTGFRLTRAAREKLDALAKKFGISQTAVLEITIREKAEEEGIDDKVGNGKKQ